MNSDKGLERVCFHKRTAWDSSCPLKSLLFSFPVCPRSEEIFRGEITSQLVQYHPNLPLRQAETLWGWSLGLKGSETSLLSLSMGKNSHSHQPLSNPHPENPPSDLSALCTQTPAQDSPTIPAPLPMEELKSKSYIFLNYKKKAKWMFWVITLFPRLWMILFLSHLSNTPVNFW